MPPLSLFMRALLVWALLLSGCASDAPKKFDYGPNKLPPLEVPPDLVKPQDNDSLGASDARGGASYSDAVAPRVGAEEAVLPSYPNMRMERAGDTRWLYVKQSPEQLWTPVRDFLSKNGLSIAAENRGIGIMETEWADNHVNASGDILQKYLGKYIPALFSSGLRDKYRVRFERAADGGSEIHLSHRGMEEVEVSEGNPLSPTKTVWRARSPDAELEAEMLRLLMEHLGAPAKAQTAAAVQATAHARLVREGDTVALQLEDTMDNAWQRVGRALDRLGYVIKERDRAKGIYHLRYTDPSAQGGDKEFWQQAIGDSANTYNETQDYQLRLEARGAGVSVQLNNRKGAALAAKEAEPILKNLEAQLK